MKKLTLLGALLCATVMQAQTTYYWPGTRVDALTNDTKYFIYNTAHEGGDRSWFLFSNGSGLGINNVSPKDFVTSEAKYIFTLTQPDDPKSQNEWNIKSANGYVGIAGVTNNQNPPRNIYIIPWASGNITKTTSAQSEDEDGNLLGPNGDYQNVFAITKVDGTNPGGTDYAWNGETTGWVRWSDAHPYAFYTVESKDIDATAIAYYQELTTRNGKLAELAFALQQMYGLVQDETKYYSNYKSSLEGSYEALIDGDDNTFFHSTYTSGPDNEGTDEDPKHYLRAELPEATSSFYLITKRRTQNNNNRPTSILVEGSNETAEDSYAPIATLSELPTASDDYFYFSVKITSPTAYKYIRFTPQGTNTNTRFFTYSEFYVIESTAESDKAMQAVHDLYTCKDLFNQTDIKNGTFESSLLTAGKKIDDVLSGKWVASAELKTLIDECEPYEENIGDGLNHFSASDEFSSAFETAEEVLNNNSSDITVINEAIEQLEEAKTTLEINQPETGKFYRIKSATLNNYISSTTVGTDNRPVMTDNPEEAVFYLTADHRLITANLQAMNNYNVVAALGTETTFKASEAVIGGYTIRNNNGSYFAKATGQVMDRHGSEDAGLTTDDCAWILEEVTDEAQQPSLSKTLAAESEYATIAAPVALNIPAGVKAYTVKVDGEVAKLTELNGVIPAGVPAVIKGEAGTTDTFTFAPEGSTTNENDLQGVYVETEIPAETTAYVLANGTQGVGFYLLDATDRTLAANKAYLVLPAGAANVKAFILNTGDLTGIESVATGAEAEEYYDLQGRRVMKPTKGIYITKSGKKVIF